MMKLSEVCKTVGVTRRTLQEYDRIGLLSPTSKDGYWLYDDDAVEKLITIRVLVEVGYDRNTIKNILSQVEVDLLDALEKTLTLLQEKKKRINGMINWVNGLLLIEKMPNEVLNALGQVDFLSMYKEKSFSERMEESINEVSEDDEKDTQNNELLTFIFWQFAALSTLKDNAPDSIIVRKKVRSVYKKIVEMSMKHEDWDREMGAEWNEMSESDKADTILLGMYELLFEDMQCEELLSEDDECRRFLNNFGLDSPEFIKEALNAYIEYLKKQEPKNVEK